MWDTIESDPGVFTSLIEALGVKGVQVEDVYSLDPIELKQFQQQGKVYGLIFLFKYKGPTNNIASTGTVDPDLAEQIFFAQQVINNACGTQAVLSILLNRPDIEIGSNLQDFKEFTAAFPSELRGEALSNSDLIRATHNSFARSDPFQSDETRAATEDDDVYHFVSYTVINGSLLELDGLQAGPINHGPCTDEEFPDKVTSLLQNRALGHDGDINFNLLAVIQDLRIGARENPGPDSAELLEREERKRKQWAKENILRRHNWMNMVYLVTKAAVQQALTEKGNIDELVETSKRNAKTRIAALEAFKNKKVKTEAMDMS